MDRIELLQRGIKGLVDLALAQDAWLERLEERVRVLEGAAWSAGEVFGKRAAAPETTSAPAPKVTP